MLTAFGSSVSKYYSQMLYESIVHTCWKPCIYWCSVPVRVAGASINSACLRCRDQHHDSMMRGAAAVPCAYLGAMVAQEKNAWDSRWNQTDTGGRSNQCRIPAIGAGAVAQGMSAFYKIESENNLEKRKHEQNTSTPR